MFLKFCFNTPSTSEIFISSYARGSSFLLSTYLISFFAHENIYNCKLYSEMAKEQAKFCCNDLSTPALLYVVPLISVEHYASKIPAKFLSLQSITLW